MNNKDIQFPLKELINLYKSSNSIWKIRLDSLLNYYKSNSFKVDKENFEFTFLLDEPDKDLDIDNIDTVYNILSYRKKLTQLISVVHNPILIYKLSKLDYVNFIELTDGYLDKIKKLIKNL